MNPARVTAAFTLDRRQLLAGIGAGAFCAPLSVNAADQALWVKQDTVAFKGKQDDIYFVNPDVGWYGNGKGKLYGTRDGGAHWDLLWEKPGTFVRALGFIDEQVGFLGNVGTDYFPGVTDTNPLYMTQDGGRTWAPVTGIDGPTPKGLCAIDIWREPFINHGDLGMRSIVRAAGRVGSPAAIMVSRDGGLTWRSQDMTAVAGMILDIKFVSPTVGFLAAASDASVDKSNALVLRTKDAGKSWHPVYRSKRPWEITWKLSFPTPQVGYVTVQNYDADPTVARRVIAKTSDGGNTWRELALVDDHAFQEFGIGFLDNERGWVGGMTGGLETRDGGRSWVPVDMGTKINKIRILKTPTGFRAFAIGENVYRLDE